MLTMTSYKNIVYKAENMSIKTPGHTPFAK